MSVFNLLWAFKTIDTAAIMQKMLAASDYWQPESVDQYELNIEPNGGALSVTHLRFSNTPQSHNESVHVSQCGHFLCVANARIDNRHELLDELRLDIGDKRDMFRASDYPDGAIILAAYQKWGEDCAAKLLGDFVFAVWDRNKNSIYIARDHLGIKTAFYSVTDDAVLVSNEHNALLESGLVSRELNDDFVLDLFLPKSNSGYYSPVKAIKRVPPAHYVVITPHSVCSECYWQLQVKQYPSLNSDEDYLRELRVRFEKAVKRRLLSAYPIGCELSEGLDSTAITGLTARMLPHQTIYTYSYDSQQLTDDNRHIYQDTYKDIFEFLALYPNLSAEWTTQQQPENYNDLIEQYYGVVAPHPGQKCTRYYLVKDRGVRTLLSGWGGDHCVTSYGAFYEDELFRKGRWLSLYQQYQYTKKRGRRVKPLFNFLKLGVKYGCPPLFRTIERRRNPLVQLLHFSATESPLNPELVTRQRLKEAVDFVDNYTSSGVRERDYRELFHVGIESRVSGSEIHARAFNFEYRYPMFDKELIEFAYSVPTHMKCKFGIERWMFREIIKDLVTERVRMRMKHDVVLPKHQRLDVKMRLKKLIAGVKDNAKLPVLQHYLRFERLDHLLQLPFVANIKALDTLNSLAKAQQEGRLDFCSKLTESSPNKKR